MKAKEKANELLRKYWNSKFNMPLLMAKECSLIAVDEILEDDMYDMGEGFFNARIQYWQEVKQEIEKL